MVLAKLHQQLPDGAAGQRAQVRAGVLIQALVQEPRVDWQALGLDQTVSDDRLLGSMLAFQTQFPSTRICLVSNDQGIRWKAGSRGIQVFDPEGPLVRLETSTPEEKELAKAQQQIREFTDHIPKIALGLLSHNQQTNQIELLYAPSQGISLSDEDIALQMASERLEIEQALESGKELVPEARLQRYQKEAETYLQELGPFLKMQQAYEYGRYGQLAFVLQNVGKVDAYNLVVHLFFPEGSFVVDLREEDEYFIKPIRPTRPKSDWVQLKGSRFSFLAGLESLDFSPALLSLPPSPPVPPMRRGPLYEVVGDRSSVGYEDPKLLAGIQWRMPALGVYFPPSQRDRDVISYVIFGDDLRGPVDGKLVIVWKQKV